MHNIIDRLKYILYFICVVACLRQSSLYAQSTTPTWYGWSEIDIDDNDYVRARASTVIWNIGWTFTVKPSVRSQLGYFYYYESGEWDDTMSQIIISGYADSLLLQPGQIYMHSEHEVEYIEWDCGFFNNFEYDSSSASTVLEPPVIQLFGESSEDSTSGFTYWIPYISKGYPSLSWQYHPAESVVWSSGYSISGNDSIATSTTNWYENSQDSDICSYNAIVTATWPNGYSDTIIANHSIQISNGNNGVYGELRLTAHSIQYAPESIGVVELPSGYWTGVLLKREHNNPPMPSIYVPTYSILYNKAFAHEMIHYAQWQNGTFCDAYWQYDALENALSLIFASTREEAINLAVQIQSSYVNSVAQLADADSHTREIQAYSSTARMPPPSRITGGF